MFIDGIRFMATSLSSLGDNVAEEICEIKCKHGQVNKKMWKM